MHTPADSLPFVRRLCAGVALAAVSLSGLQSASAQDRPTFEILPDYEQTVVEEGLPAIDHQLDYQLQLESSALGTLSQAQMEGAAASLAERGWLRWELLPALTLRAHSMLHGESAAGDAEDIGISGEHWLTWQWVPVEATPDQFGLDVALTYRGQHTNTPHAFQGPTWAGGNAARHDVSLAVVPQLGLAPFEDPDTGGQQQITAEDDVQLLWQLPLQYQLAVLDHEGSPLAPADELTHTFESGLRIGDDHGIFDDGHYELVGISLSRTTFRDSGCNSFEIIGSCEEGASQGGISQIDLRQLSVQDLLLEMAPGVWLLADMHFGESFLWNEETQDSATLFTFDWGVGAFADNGDQRFGSGLSFARQAGWSPGGDRLIAHHRLEVFAEYTTRSLGMGLVHRDVFDWMAHPEIEGLNSTLPDAVPALALYTEWFATLPPFDLGVYHRATYDNQAGDPAVDVWDRPRDWANEVGAFLRVDIEP